MGRPTDEEMLLYYDKLEGTYVKCAINLANWAMDQVEQSDEDEWEVPRSEKYGPALKTQGVMSFDEWNKDRFKRDSSEDFELARQGMIPAANAIQIPDEKDWHELAKSIKLIYSSNENDYPIQMTHDVIKVIPRSKPQWVPKVGNPVFALCDVKTIVAKIIDINDNWLVIDYDGRAAFKHEVTYYGDKIYAKPFDASKIGLPWDQI